MMMTMRIPSATYYYCIVLLSVWIAAVAGQQRTGIIESCSG